MPSLQGHEQARVAATSGSEENLSVQQDGRGGSFHPHVRFAPVRLIERAVLGHRENDGVPYGIQEGARHQEQPDEDVG